jgi:hypothetical protein
MYSCGSNSSITIVAARLQRLRQHRQIYGSISRAVEPQQQQQQQYACAVQENIAPCANGNPRACHIMQVLLELPADRAAGYY